MKDKLDILKKEIVVSGFGGQGIILAGKILGQAAVLGDHKNSTLVQSYGPESRGGACSAQVVISDGTIHYPYVRNPDILVCMSQSAFEKFIGSIKEDGILLVDHDLVEEQKIDRKVYSVPSTRMAEELGRKMMANIIMVGFITAVTEVVTRSAAESAVASSVPKGTEKTNIEAFNKGYDYGIAVLKGREKKAEGIMGA